MGGGSMTNSLTPWFAGTEKPVRAGWYERQGFPENVMSYWNGVVWMYGGNGTGWYVHPRQDLPWRGVLRDAQALEVVHG